MDCEKLRRLLLKKNIATMPELKAALDTEVDLTVFRKLREISYRSSYSHKGKYYTLDEIARFDEMGLWSFRAVWFSKHGTLLRTCEALIAHSEAGFAADELDNVLHVGVHDALRKLAADGRIYRKRFGEWDLPIVSIDAKKKEMVGNFKNGGSTWDKAEIRVNDHDFPSDAEGVALPGGIYDLRANRGTIFIGTSHDTPYFAAENLARWWSMEGMKRYPDAEDLLVLADSGGSNGPRNRAFKYGLQMLLCNTHHLTVTVCHYPAGASKWNPIEHRLFSEISKNWSGKPLDSYETVLKYIRTTRTETGLRVTAKLVKKRYRTGIKISNAQMNMIDLQPHKIQPQSNYSICPTN